MTRDQRCAGPDRNRWAANDVDSRVTREQFIDNMGWNASVPESRVEVPDAVGNPKQPKLQNRNPFYLNALLCSSCPELLNSGKKCFGLTSKPVRKDLRLYQDQNGKAVYLGPFYGTIKCDTYVTPTQQKRLCRCILPVSAI